MIIGARGLCWFELSYHMTDTGMDFDLKPSGVNTNKGKPSSASSLVNLFLHSKCTYIVRASHSYRVSGNVIDFAPDLIFHGLHQQERLQNPILKLRA